MQSNPTSATQNELSANARQNLPLQILNPNRKVLPVRKFVIIGGIQVVLGILTAIMSLAGIVVGGMSFGFVADVCNGVSVCLSVMAIVTGSLPLCCCMDLNKKWHSFKIAFLVCSIIEATITAPGRIISACWMLYIGIIYAEDIFYEDYTDIIAVSITITALSFFSMITAIISACFCCCTTWSSNEQQVFVYMGEAHPNIMSLQPQTQIRENQATQEQPVALSTLASQGQSVVPIERKDIKHSVLITKRTNNQPQQFRIVSSTSQPTNSRPLSYPNQRYIDDPPPPYTKF